MFPLLFLTSCDSSTGLIVTLNSKIGLGNWAGWYYNHKSEADQGTWNVMEINLYKQVKKKLILSSF